MAENTKFEKNLTRGNVFSELIIFAVPFFISNLIQCAYSVADMIILGHFAGASSVSAVNTSSQVVIILTNLAAGLSSGGSVMIGQYLGAEQKEKINKAISTLLTTLFFMGIAFSAILLLLDDPILRLMNVQLKAYPEAKSYLIINLIGLVFVFGYNAISAIMRGLGDSKTPLIFVGMAGIMNIVLDFILIAVFHLGATGAAAATIFSQGFSMISCIVYLKANHFQFDFSLKSMKWDKEMFKTLMMVGLPMGVQHVCTNLSFLVLTSMINLSGGIEAGAAAGVVNKFNSFAILPSVAISASVSAMISQNVGAKKDLRVKETFRYGMVLCIGICVVIFIIANTCTTMIFHVFGSEPEVIEIGIKYMHVFSFEYVGLPIIIGYNAVFTGTGNGWVSLITNIVSAFVVRIPVAIVMGGVLGYGVIGVVTAVPIATIVGALITAGFYYAGAWKKSLVEL